MKNIVLKLLFIGVLWAGHVSAQPAQLVAKSGSYLDYTPIISQSASYQLNIGNQQTDSVFCNSSVGGGYQYELLAGEQFPVAMNGSNSSQRLVECQQPLGNPVCCATSCGNQAVEYMGTQYVCYGALQAFAGPTTATINLCQGGSCQPKTSPLIGLDILNEKGSNTSDLNYVFLDTILNNSNLTTGSNPATQLGVAITDAPLYRFSGSGADPASLVGAINAGSFSIAKNLFPNIASQQQVNFALGSNTHTLTILSTPDARYTIFGASQHNPANNQLAYKYHMADPNLALSTDAVKGTQTIILFPVDTEHSCQPVIFIGKDHTDGSLLALTYFIANWTLTDQTQCCLGQNSQPCQQDGLYLTSTITPAEFGGTSAAINPNSSSTVYSTSSKPLGGTPTNLTLSPGRIRLIIDNVTGLQLGYASHLDVLAGLYAPGQTDFTNPSASVPSC